MGTTIYRLGKSLTPARKTYMWRALTIASLALVIIGSVYAWQEMPDTEVAILPRYLLFAMVIYVFTYVLHLFGWHVLASRHLGPLKFRENMEAVATSDLVKYLPTVAWYIGSRIHYYDQRKIARRSVVAASLLEMAAILFSGSFIYLLLRISNYSLTLEIAILLSVIVFALLWLWPVLREWADSKAASMLVVPPRKLIRPWLLALFWYGSSWLAGALFLATLLHTFVPVRMTDLPSLLSIWLVAGLTGYVISLTLGTIGIAREATLTFLLAQVWPLPVAIAAAILVKVVLTVGQIGCALLILTGLRFISFSRQGYHE
jgi:hypothetical protein